MKHSFMLFALCAMTAFPAWAVDSANNTVSIPQIEEAVAKALVEKGAGSRVQAMMLGQAGKQQLYSADTPLSVEVKSVNFEKNSSRWSANVLFVSEGKVLSALPASGRFQEMMQLPVLARAIRAGEVITDADVEYADYPQPRLRGDLVTDADALIGKSPQRMLSAHRPLRTADLSMPSVVRKNALVQINFKTANMEISTSGQALDAGAKGDVITVRNLTSKTIIHAVVEDEKNVSVAPMAQSTALMDEGAKHVN